MDNYLILVINPGSTSTKAAVFKNEELIAEKTLRYSKEELAKYPTIMDQKAVRTGDILKFLEEENISFEQLNAVVGRGGMLKPLDSGVYEVNQAMLDDLHTLKAARHASALGGLIAYDIGKKYDIPAYIVDPVVIDEMEPYAKLTGIPGVLRDSCFHALNSKAVARKCAEELGMKYEDARIIVAHMGGGISVGAHRYGRVIDVSNGISGEGPFTPERSGAAPLEQVISMCYSGEHTREEMLAFVNKRGGVSALLGTTDMVAVEKMVRDGDAFAALVLEALVYQVAKEIGAMMPALDSRADAIILTGGLAYSKRITGAIKQRVDQLAPVFVFPGEDELSALALGALRVLTNKEKPLIYS